MIFVNAIANRRAPWPTGRAAQLVSDQDLDELFDFALGMLSVPLGRYRHPSLFDFPHFLLTPSQRKLALLRGARAAARDEFAAALERFRERNPDAWISPKRH